MRWIEMKQNRKAVMIDASNHHNDKLLGKGMTEWKLTMLPKKWNLVLSEIDRRYRSIEHHNVRTSMQIDFRYRSRFESNGK